MDSDFHTASDKNHARLRSSIKDGKMETHAVRTRLPVRVSAVVAAAMLVGATACTPDGLSPTASAMVDNEPVEVSRLFVSGKGHLEKDRFGSALEDFKAALVKSPNSVRILNAIGASYDRLGRHDVAEPYYRRALSIEPDSVQTMNNIGYSLMLQGKYADAMPFLGYAAKSADPENLSVIAARNYEMARRAIQDSATATIERASLSMNKEVTEARKTCVVGPVWLEKSGERVYALITEPSAVSQAAMKQLSSSYDARTGVKDGLSVASCNSVVREVYGVVPRVSEAEEGKKPSLMSPEVKDVRERVVTTEVVVPKAGFEEPSRRADAVLSPVVDVSNGAGRNELAKRISGHFAKNGLKVDRITNAANFDHIRTTIFYRKGFEEIAARYANVLPMSVTLESSDLVASDLRVLLGSDILSFDGAVLLEGNRKLSLLMESWT